MQNHQKCATTTKSIHMPCGLCNVTVNVLKVVHCHCKCTMSIKYIVFETYGFKRQRYVFCIAQYPVRSSPDRPVHSDTNSPSLGSVLAVLQSCATTTHSHFHHCLEPRTHLYSWVNWNIMERERKCPNFETVANGDSNPGSLDGESGVLTLS